MKKNITIAALAIWATLTFIGLVSESESFTVLVIVKAVSFISAVSCIKVCSLCEKKGIFSVEDDSPDLV